MSQVATLSMTVRRPFFRPHLAESAPRPAAAAQVRPTQPATPAATAPSPGDRERFRQTMLPHLDAAYGFARYLCRDAALAEDIVQEAYLKAWRAFPGWRGGSAKAWLFAIVRNGFLSGLPAQSLADDASAERPDDEQDSPEDAVLRRETVETVRAAVTDLPDPFRETLVLRELEEMTYREIADITGAPIGTVMSRLARARQMLLERLGASSHAPEAGR